MLMFLWQHPYPLSLTSFASSPKGGATGGPVTSYWTSKFFVF